MANNHNNPVEEEVDTDKGKNELAEDRTDWAMQRTLLAKERTFSAWARTGTSAMVAGLGIAKFLPSIDSPVARILGVVLICTGGIIFVTGFFSYRKALQKLADENIRGTSMWIITIVTLALVASAVLALMLILNN